MSVAFDEEELAVVGAAVVGADTIVVALAVATGPAIQAVLLEILVRTYRSLVV